MIHITQILSKSERQPLLQPYLPPTIVALCTSLEHLVQNQKYQPSKFLVYKTQYWDNKLILSNGQTRQTTLLLMSPSGTGPYTLESAELLELSPSNHT